MKLYNKPELNVEKFDVADILTASQVEAEKGNGDMELSAGLEFDVSDLGNEF